MPKSNFELGTLYLNNFSYFLTQIWHKKRHLLVDYDKFDINEFYKDFHGWEYILFITNGDVPILRLTCYLCLKNSIDNKLARYQVKKIFEKYLFDENSSKKDIDLILSVFEID